MAKVKKKQMTAGEMGRKGGKARSESLSKGELSKIGKKGAAAKWANVSDEERKKHGAMLTAARAKKRKAKNK